MHPKGEYSVRKQDLIRQVAEATGQKETESAKAVNAVFDVIGSALAAGDDVSISGFGAFKVVDRPQRQGLNPQTRQPMTIEARRSPVFRPGTRLKRLLG